MNKIYLSFLIVPMIIFLIGFLIGIYINKDIALLIWQWNNKILISTFIIYELIKVIKGLFESP